jgi:hypothetical protein
MDGTLKTKVGMTSFVDNNNCNVNCWPKQETSLRARAEHNAQLWNNILWGSGAALEHSKSTYKYLRTEFTATGTPYFQAGSFGTPITIRDNSGQTTPIEHSSAYHAYKTLGTYQAATKRQTIDAKEKGDNTSQEPGSKHVLCQCSVVILQQYLYERDWLPPVRQQSVKDSVETIPSPHYRINTQPLRISEIVKPHGRFWVSSLLGLEFALLDTTQGAGKIQLLLQNFCTPGQPHNMALVVVDQSQYNAGVGFHILEDAQRELLHLKGIWIPTVRAYLTIINGSLQIAEARIQ